MVTPAYLKQGDTIGIVAPARKITYSQIEYSINIFESWGLTVKTGKNLFGDFHQFSGTDKQRCDDFNEMIYDDSIKAIICARGGYGTIRILDNIDFEYFKNHPKWISGYSDITAIHSHVNTCLNIETVHSTMPIDFSDKPDNIISQNSLKNVLFGENIEYTCENQELYRAGSTTAQIIGGNLSILFALLSTKSEIDTNQKILFIEDVDEYLYHIDRMMVNLKRAGKLNNLRGLIVGGMTDMKDNEIPYGFNVTEIIASAIAEYEYPVCFNFTAGHQPLNLALIMGREIDFTVNKNNTIIKFK